MHRGIQEAVSWRQLKDFLENQAPKVLRYAMEQVLEQARSVVDGYEDGWKQAFGELEKALYNELHTYSFFLDSIPGGGHRDVALDLPSTLMQIRLDMDATFRRARQLLEQPRKRAQMLAAGAWLPANGNPLARIMGTMQERRAACHTAVDRTLDDLGEDFRLCAMEAAEILSAGDCASAKRLGQLYVQSLAEQFRWKQPELAAYQAALESQLEEQRAILGELRAMEAELARWTGGTDSKND